MKTWVRLIPFIFCCSIIFIFVYKTPVFSDSLDLEFSVQHGFFDQPFNLTISSEDNIDQIWYTFDGRDPAKSNTFKIGNEPVELLIDPNNENMPSIAPGVVVRAVGIKNSVIITPSVTHT